MTAYDGGEGPHRFKGVIGVPRLEQEEMLKKLSYRITQLFQHFRETHTMSHKLRLTNRLALAYRNSDSHRG